MEYQFESIGPALRWVVLAFLFVSVIAAVSAVAAIAAVPGWIARRRQHPQAAAINVCGWFGLPTGVLWVIAIVWSYLNWPAEKGMTGNGIAEADIGRLSEQISQIEAAVSNLEDRTR